MGNLSILKIYVELREKGHQTRSPWLVNTGSEFQHIECLKAHTLLLERCDAEAKCRFTRLMTTEMIRSYRRRPVSLLDVSRRLYFGTSFGSK